MSLRPNGQETLDFLYGARRLLRDAVLTVQAVGNKSWPRVISRAERELLLHGLDTLILDIEAGRIDVRDLAGLSVESLSMKGLRLLPDCETYLAAQAGRTVYSSVLSTLIEFVAPLKAEGVLGDLEQGLAKRIHLFGPDAGMRWFRRAAITTLVRLLGDPLLRVLPLLLGGAASAFGFLLHWLTRR